MRNVKPYTDKQSDVSLPIRTNALHQQTNKQQLYRSILYARRIHRFGRCMVEAKRREAGRRNAQCAQHSRKKTPIEFTGLRLFYSFGIICSVNVWSNVELIHVLLQSLLINARNLLTVIFLRSPETILELR